MSKDRVYTNLSNRVASENIDLVANFLEQHGNIDVTYGDGKFFNMSICGKNNVAITRLLINYFETVQLPKLAKDSPEYNILRYRFKTALETAVEGETLSEEMKSLLSKYIDFDPDDEQDASKDPDEVLAQDEEHHDGLSDEHITREGSGDGAAHDSLTAATLVQGQNPITGHDTIEAWLAGHSTAVSEDL